MTTKQFKLIQRQIAKADATRLKALENQKKLTAQLIGEKVYITTFDGEKRNGVVLSRSMPGYVKILIDDYYELLTPIYKLQPAEPCNNNEKEQTK